MFDLAAKVSVNRIRVVHTSAPQAAAGILQRCTKAGDFLVPDGRYRVGVHPQTSLGLLLNGCSI